MNSIGFYLDVAVTDSFAAILRLICGHIFLGDFTALED